MGRHSPSPPHRSSVTTHSRGCPRGVLINAAVQQSPQRHPPAALPRGAPAAGSGPPLHLPSPPLVRGDTPAALAVPGCRPRRKAALYDVTPRLSARGADVRVDSGPSPPLLAARPRISAVVPRPRPRWWTSALTPRQLSTGNECYSRPIWTYAPEVCIIFCPQSARFFTLSKRLLTISHTMYLLANKVVSN